MISPVRAELPTGTVTFVFTDVESSTRLLAELGDRAYSRALAEHRKLIREASARLGGVEVDTQGDSFFLAFATARAAIEAVREIGAGLAGGPISVRMGVHTGTPLITDEGYVGADVHRAARIAASGHGGQVLVSASTAALVDLELRDLGEHRFKDLAEPERVFQLGHGEYPPIRSLRNVRLPVPATPFLGRKDEVEGVVELLTRGDLRLLTLTGPGGTGKTRLALQAAAEASDRFPDGTWFVALAPLRDPGLVLSAVAGALELKEQPGHPLENTLAAELGQKQALLVLDNVEHLLPGAADDIGALAAAAQATLLVTSRERLQLRAERVYPVPALTEREGIELFLSRARALDPDFSPAGSMAQLCTRLDNLPLALELAAARTTLFSTDQLLRRLSQRLDLLKGGRDLEPRQQTLRATIDWSHDLLAPDERRLFRTLSVFADCTYEAAEEVCGADPDTLQSLLDKSLLRRRDSPAGVRFWMLETIREYASERLEESGDAPAVRLRHAEWCCELADRLVGPPGPWLRGEEFGDFQDDYDNVRTALAWTWASGHDELGLRLATVRFWMRHGLFRDAVAWLEAAAPKIDRGTPQVQLQALKAAGLITQFVLADPERADAYWARGQSVAEDLGDAGAIAWIEDRRSGVDWDRGDFESGIRHFGARAKHYGERGDRLGEADALHLLGENLRDLGRFDEAEKALADADALFRELGLELGVANNTHSRADLALDRGDGAEALRLYREALEVVRSRGVERSVAYCLAGMARVLAARGQDVEAATIWGAVCAAEETLGFRMLAAERRRYENHLARLESTPAWTEGRRLTLEEAVGLTPAP
jgi:predicted ATPase/class 3 adenylate cyclase